MMHMVAVFEDTTIVATRGEEKWEVRLQDSLSGRNAQVYLTDTQFGCMMFLASGAGEDGQIIDSAIQAAYAVVEPEFNNVPAECRPFP